MFKPLVFLALCLVPSFFVSAQVYEPAPGELDSFFADISIHSPLPTECSFPFASIQVIDSRPDTGKIGFIPDGPKATGKNAFKQIFVAGGLQFKMEEMLKRHYRSCFKNIDQKLVIVLKRFWADPFPSRRSELPGKTDVACTFDMYLTFEFFIEKSGWYYPIKKIDTLFQACENGLVEGCGDRHLRKCKMYGYAVEKLIGSLDFNFYSVRLDKIKNKLTLDQLNYYNSKVARYPVLNATVLTAGVYLSFTDFKNNSPSITRFRHEIVKSKIGDRVLLYAVTDSSEESINNFWGYCDGEELYYGRHRNTLWRVGHTYEFFDRTIISNKGKSHPLMSALELDLTAAERMSDFIFNERYEKWEPFQIDMETGRIY